MTIKQDYFWGKNDSTQHASLIAWLGQLPASGVLLQLYSASLSAPQAQVLAQLVGQHAPQSQIMGASFSKIIVAGELYSDGYLLLALPIPSQYCDIVVQPLLLPHPKTGYALLEQCRSPFMLCLAAGISVGDASVFQAFEKRNAPEVSGAIALENSAGAPWILAGTQTYRSGLVVAGLNSPAHAGQHGFVPQWYPVGRSMRVTRSQDKRVFEVESRNSLELYRAYLGCQLPSTKIDLADFPLLGDEDGRYVVAQPDHIHQDGSMTFTEQLNEGELVRLGYHDRQLIEETIRRHRHDLSQFFGPLIIFYCRGCTTLKATKPAEEIQLLCGERPGFGGLCGGEIVSVQGHVMIYHHAMAYWGATSNTNSASPQLSDNAESYHQHALFHLISRSLDDLSNLNKDLKIRVKHQQQKLLETLIKDTMTGLPNRTALLNDIRDHSGHQQIHLMAFKIDNFSSINRYYGYDGGDRLLRVITTQLEAFSEKLSWAGVKCYRSSANEFVVSSYQNVDLDLFEGWSQELLFGLQQLDIYPDDAGLTEVLNVTLAGGIASSDSLSTGADSNPELLIIRAVEALKTAQKSHLLLVVADSVKRIDEQEQQIQIWLSRTKRALQNGGIIPYFQPIVDAKDGRWIGVECLMRMQDGDTIYAPGQFLPIIKETNLYASVSRAMLSQSIHLMGESELFYSVNLSVDDLLNSGTMLLLRELVSLVPNKPIIEIVESEQLRQLDDVEVNLSALRDMGCQLAIDDFGAGYSNWEKMLQLKPELLKIDGSLITQADQNRSLQVMLESISSMAKALGIRTVAEYVESQQEVDLMRKLGIDRLQGYYFSKPIPAAEIIQYQLNQLNKIS
jgi:EAL domain-containing protein (putative c-di-GMP-specific phosphodiesterase class I)/GGDEF domain-containing protein